MFKHLKLKIEGTIMLILVISSIIISITSYIALKFFITNNFISLASNSFSQSIDNVSTYMKLIQESSNLLMENNTVLEVLRTNDYNTDITSVLNLPKNSYSGILGVVLINSYGNEYLSESVSYYPSLTVLRYNKDINNFISSKKNSFWFIRDNYTAEYYNRNIYDEKLGVITFMTKIFDKNKKMLGFLCIDIDPNYLYSLFLDNNSGFINNSRIYISIDTIKILSHRNEDYLDNYLKKEISLKSNPKYWIDYKNKFLLLYDNLFYNNKAILAIPLTLLYNKLKNLLILLLIINLIIIALAFLMGNAISNSICKPLIKLYNKMKKSYFN